MKSRPMPMASFQYVSSSAAETKKIGSKIARHLHPKDVVVFLAQLGAGKTTLIQGLIRGLGIKEAALSPTFIIAQTFEGKIPVHHLDFYRLSSAEIVSMGIQDYLMGQGEIKPGLVLIEWAERCKHIWPKERLEVHIQIVGSRDKRKIVLRGTGSRFVKVINKLKK